MKPHTYNVDQVIPVVVGTLERILHIVADEVAGVHITPPLFCKVRSPRLPHFILDGSIPYNHGTGNAKHIFFGHYIQRGGVRIIFPCVEDKIDIATQVLSVRSFADSMFIHRWEIGVGAAQLNNGLMRALREECHGVKLNKKDTPQLIQTRAIIALITHGIFTSDMQFLIPQVVTNVAQYLQEVPARPVERADRVLPTRDNCLI